MLESSFPPYNVLNEDNLLVTSVRLNWSIETCPALQVALVEHQHHQYHQLKATFWNVLVLGNVVAGHGVVLNIGVLRLNSLHIPRANDVVAAEVALENVCQLACCLNLRLRVDLDHLLERRIADGDAHTSKHIDHATLDIAGAVLGIHLSL